MHIFGEGLSFGMGEFWGGTLVAIGVIWTCSLAGGVFTKQASMDGLLVMIDPTVLLLE